MEPAVQPRRQSYPKSQEQYRGINCEIRNSTTAMQEMANLVTTEDDGVISNEHVPVNQDPNKVQSPGESSKKPKGNGIDQYEMQIVQSPTENTHADKSYDLEQGIQTKTGESKSLVQRILSRLVQHFQLILIATAFLVVLDIVFLVLGLLGVSDKAN